jgi:hypothetical protein
MRAQQQKVIGHDREGVNMPGAANRRLTKLFLKPIAIHVVAHDVLTPITAGHDMINRVAALKAPSPWHALHCNMLASGSQESFCLGLTLRHEARERRIISQCETFH